MFDAEDVVEELRAQEVYHDHEAALQEHVAGIASGAAALPLIHYHRILPMAFSQRECCDAVGRFSLLLSSSDDFCMKEFAVSLPSSGVFWT